MDSKVCTKCGTEKLLEEFTKHKRSKGGIRSQCRACDKVYKKAYYASDRGKNVRDVYTQTTKYKDSKREYNKLPSRKKYKKSYYQSPEGKASSARAAHMRRLRVENTVCDLTAQEWEEIRLTQNYRCAMCGEVTFLHRDHIIPVSKGGGLTKSNVQGMCKNCNARKWAHIIEEEDGKYETDMSYM